MKQYELWYQDKFNDSHRVAAFEEPDDLKLCLTVLPKKDYYIVEVKTVEERNSINTIDYLIKHKNED